VEHCHAGSVCSTAVRSECAAVTDIASGITFHSFNESFKYQLSVAVQPSDRAILEKLTVSQLIKHLVAFYRSRRFISVFTTSHHLSLS